MAKIKPAAELAARAGDEELTVEQLSAISLLAQLKEQPDWKEFPGTMLLRHYHRGDVICHLGEPGWTAFYILTRKDLRELRESQVRTAWQLEDQLRRQKKRAERLRKLRRRWESELEGLGPEEPLAPAADPAADPLKVATVYLGSAHQPGLWNGLKRLSLPLIGRGKNPPSEQVDALHEGELFGEMSCLYRTPRSATVVVERDCYMLEMLRNILDKLLSNRNRAFKEQTDAVYRQRALEGQLRSLPMFQDLPASLLHALRDRVELKDLEPGELLCDEFDRSDSMYLIRNGFVKVLKNGSHLLSVAAIPDWSALCAGLCAGAEEPAGPRRQIWELLPEAPVRGILRAASAGVLPTAAERQQIIHALNDLLKGAKFSAAVEFKEILQTAGLAEEAKKLPSGIKKWTAYQQVCGLNRRLLQAIYPEIMPQRHWSAADARILSYCSRGDPIGEVGLATGEPRGATCVAYDHPDSKFGRVELVRIGKGLFQDMMAASTALRTRVDRLMAERLRHTRERLAKPAWEKFGPGALSERFDELGLIQGQQLMLIDLDRCTRCDECVQACVATHPDGRSRLFLDGPRFHDSAHGQVKNYLVPATCRQCKDPVCLIGCPVGSIHKGENGQIAIEDWCIGCNRCAEQCPYEAIQMHPIGLIPRRTHGWRYRRAPDTPARRPWQGLEFADHAWIPGQTPFHYDRDLRERLAHPTEIHFRRAFDVPASALQEAATFQLQILSLAPALSVWVNGNLIFNQVNGQKAPLKPKEKGELWNLEAILFPESQSGKRQEPGLRAGKNVLAISAAPTLPSVSVLLEVGLYHLAKPILPAGTTGEFTQEQVMNLAVVCDLCSAQFGQRPACVNACPHDAAFRVDARTLFAKREAGRFS